jgi:hypothetical protein
MDYEHFVAVAACVVEFTGVAVLLLGALLAASSPSRQSPSSPPISGRTEEVKADRPMVLVLSGVPAEQRGDVVTPPAEVQSRSTRHPVHAMLRACVVKARWRRPGGLPRSRA